MSIVYFQPLFGCWVSAGNVNKAVCKHRSLGPVPLKYKPKRAAAAHGSGEGGAGIHPSPCLVRWPRKQNLVRQEWAWTADTKLPQGCCPRRANATAADNRQQDSTEIKPGIHGDPFENKEKAAWTEELKPEQPALARGMQRVGTPL